MAHFQTEEQTRVKRAQVQRAQQLAAQGAWEEAVALNREILAATPNEVASLNRLGKALSELSRYHEAYETYSRALERDPTNQIARRNVQRLEPLKDQGVVPTTSEHRRTQARQSIFIEEVGKTRVTELYDLAPNEQILQMNSGDRVELKVEEKQIVAYSEDGIRLGRLPARLALRLITLIKGGNRYGAAVTAAEPGTLRVIVRELYQHPSQVGRLSFPVETKPVAPRPYVRDTQRTRFPDDADFLNADDDDEDTDDEADADEEDEFTDETGIDEPEEEPTI